MSSASHKRIWLMLLFLALSISCYLPPVSASPIEETAQSKYLLETEIAQSQLTLIAEKGLAATNSAPGTLSAQVTDTPIALISATDTPSGNNSGGPYPSSIAGTWITHSGTGGQLILQQGPTTGKSAPITGSVIDNRGISWSIIDGSYDATAGQLIFSVERANIWEAFILEISHDGKTLTGTATGLGQSLPVIFTRP